MDHNYRLRIDHDEPKCIYNHDNSGNNNNNNNHDINISNNKGTRRRRRAAAVNLVAFISLAWLLNLMSNQPMGTEAAGDSLGSAAPTSSGVIKITRFQVPSLVRPGEYRRLACLYELQGATLHAMKLFKDDKEFYRYTPADHKMIFPIAGVQVDINKSTEREVWLRINKRSAGRYKCQVSIEGTFNSVIEEKRMDLAQEQSQSHSDATGGSSLGRAGGSGSNGGIWLHGKAASDSQQMINSNGNNLRPNYHSSQAARSSSVQQTPAAAATTTTTTTGNGRGHQLIPTSLLASAAASSSAAAGPAAGLHNNRCGPRLAALMLAASVGIWTCVYITLGSTIIIRRLTSRLGYPITVHRRRPAGKDKEEAVT